MTNFSKIIVQIIAVFLLAVIVVNADWSAPTASPPNANTPAPVNVGSTTQEKAGILGVGAFSSFGDAFFGGNMKLSPGTSGNTFEFGYGVSGKEGNAGKIGYERWTTGALDIVGAGTQAGSRKVKIWDVLDTGSLCLSGDCKTAWSQVGGGTGGGDSITLITPSVDLATAKTGVYLTEDQWFTINATSYGVPSTAKAVILQIDYFIDTNSGKIYIKGGNSGGSTSGAYILVTDSKSDRGNAQGMFPLVNGFFQYRIEDYNNNSLIFSNFSAADTNLRIIGYVN